ncbi:MAG TPA: hypothetical protein VF765_16625 [Polyangiaceae bacterium]
MGGWTMHPPPIRVLALLCVPALLACAGGLSRGVGQFDDGRYPEAKQTFASLEPESRSWDDAHRARYALYRGLTYGALGDKARAATWLREARAIVLEHPDALSPEDRQRLKAGLDTYEVP